ncbi:hypothetical protein BRC88_13460 [Halobacteriales archaeon QS_4_69_225]|nr:MAG: hypothetical protein BRC88_13460 [Halobacteriales archaeon QS_4_69_225]
MVKLSRRTALRTAGIVAGFGLGGCLRLGSEQGDCEKGRTVHDHDVELSADAEWGHPRYDAANTGYNPDATGPESLEDPAWRYAYCAPFEDLGCLVHSRGVLQFGPEQNDARTGERIEDLSDDWEMKARFRGARVVDGVTYDTAGRDVFARDGDDERWRTAPEDEDASLLGVAGGSVFVTAGTIDSKRTYALDAETGDQLWSVEVHPDGLAAIADGRVYMGVEDSVLLALDAATGEECWRRDLELFRIELPVAVTGDAIYAAGAGGRAASLTRDGERCWNVETDVDTLVSPTVAAGTVYTGGGFTPRSGSLVALNADDGTTRATFGTRQYDDGEVAYAGLTTGPVAVEGVLYVPTRAGDIYAFD